MFIWRQNGGKKKFFFEKKISAIFLWKNDPHSRQNSGLRGTLKETPVLVCMVFVFCVLCIIVYCAEKFLDLYTKNEEFSHSEATTFLHATRKFWLSFPPKILNLPERKTKIGPSSVKWQSSSESHCFENVQIFFSTVKTPWKWPKSPKMGLKTCVFLCIFWQF